MLNSPIKNSLDNMRHYSTYQSQFIEMFSGMSTTPIKTYVDDSFPGEWGAEDIMGNGVKVIRTTNFTNSGKLNLVDVVTRNIEDRKVARKQIRKYDTILERSGGTADNPVGRVVLFEEDDLFLCNNFTQVLRFKDVDPRFAFYSLYYFYQTNKTAIRSMGSKTTGIQNLNMSKYLEIGIPNASDEEQKAFVAIVEQADKSKFTSLKSQFIEMFKDENLVPLGNICNIEKGTTITRNDVQPGNIPVVAGGQEPSCYHNISNREAGAITVSASGAYAGYINFWDCPIFASDCNTIIPKDVERVDQTFIYFGLKSMQQQIYGLQKGGAQPHVYGKDLQKFLFPNPPYAKQIVFSEIAKQADKSKYIN